MIKINKKIKTGTQVLVSGDPEAKLRKVILVNDTRVNLKVEGLAGSFQSGHIKKFSNK